MTAKAKRFPSREIVGWAAAIPRSSLLGTAPLDAAVRQSP